MDVKIIYSSQNADKAEGLAVIIDVLRAFSTACFAVNNGAKAIIPVAEINLAYKLKKENPEYILIGERHGLRQPGFDYGNSPAEIENVNFGNKTIIHTTTHATQAIIKAVNADEIVTGAFVNAQAIINYIKKREPKIVSLVCTDAKEKDNEDIMCAKYFKGHLEGKPLDFEEIKNHLENHPCAKGFLVKPLNEFSKRDFYLSLELDRFDFVLKAKKDKNFIKFFAEFD